MATVGQVLAIPDSGYKRVDSTDSNITYTGTVTTNENVNEFGGSDKRLSINAEAKFNFTGSKLRILGQTYTSVLTNNTEVYIDNIQLGTINEIGAYLNQVLLIDYNGTNGEHYCRIVNKNGEFSFDSLDISDSGILKPYNIITSKFLIKQNSNYYTVKSINYDSTTSHNFTPLTLVGGTTPNKSEIENFAFDDLNILTNSMTVNTDTFIPINKFDNTAELKMYRG